MRAALKISATEHELRFSALHEKRAETIAQTYALLKELFFRLADYVKIFEPAGANRRTNAAKPQRTHTRNSKSATREG